jgi:hypothetical protein
VGLQQTVRSITGSRKARDRSGSSLTTTMSPLFVALFALVASSCRTRGALQTEILALRHLAVFQKNAPIRISPTLAGLRFVSMVHLTESYGCRDKPLSLHLGRHPIERGNDKLA